MTSNESAFYRYKDYRHYRRSKRHRGHRDYWSPSIKVRKKTHSVSDMQLLFLDNGIYSTASSCSTYLLVHESYPYAVDVGTEMHCSRNKVAVCIKHEVWNEKCTIPVRNYLADSKISC